ncbi:hypothetical protein ACP70R_030156 [Stipagrostis hirtigluma subsp. patula]
MNGEASLLIGMASVRRNDTWDNRLRPIPNRSITLPKRVSPRRAVEEDATVAPSGSPKKGDMTKRAKMSTVASGALADGGSRTQAPGVSRVYYSGPRVLDLNAPVPGEYSTETNTEQCQDKTLPHMSTEQGKSEARSAEAEAPTETNEVANKETSEARNLPTDASASSKRKKDKLPRCLLRLY